MARTSASRGPDLPLYPDEATIARAILGPTRAQDWAAIASIWERSGLPKIDPQTGGRYWPAVIEWLDRRNGVRDSTLPAAQSGAERWENDGRRQRARA